MTESTIFPAGTIIHTMRGLSSFATSNSVDLCGFGTALGSPDRPIAYLSRKLRPDADDESDSEPD